MGSRVDLFKYFILNLIVVRVDVFLQRGAIKLIKLSMMMMIDDVINYHDHVLMLMM